MNPAHVTASDLVKEFRLESASYLKKAVRGGDGARLWELRAERAELMAKIVSAVIERDRDGSTAAINRRIADMESKVVMLEHQIRCLDENHEFARP